jgi:hypothetical protein
MEETAEIWMHIIAICIVLFFTFFYSLLIFFNSKIDVIVKIIILIPLLCAIYLGLNRDTYLPFLGKCAFTPRVILNEIIPEGCYEYHNLKLDNIENGTRVIYWGALKDTNVSDTNNVTPKNAYGNYSNSGIAIVKNNTAKLYFHCPMNYNVGSRKIDKHIHYRLCIPNNPILSKIYTEKIYC